MVDCAKCIYLLSGFADGVLTEAEKSEIETHLEGCADCRALLSVYQRISDAAQDSMAEPPADFTAGVMEKIHAAEKPASVSPKKKSLRPVIISFVAAAACLALVFVIRPQLFHLAGSSSKMTTNAASRPEAAAAPMADPMSSDAGEEIQFGVKTAEDMVGTEQAEHDQDTGAGTNEGIILGVEPTEAPAVSTEAGGQPVTLAPVPGSDGIAPAEYYAVITVKGQLPEILLTNARMANSDGTFNIEVTLDIAARLIEEGYPAEKGDTGKEMALVVYTPE